jgi:mono/diheme cytochrome c family protein
MICELRRVRPVLMVLAIGLAPVGAQSGPTTGADVFQAACAGCHGSDGKGSPRSRVGFPEELPDFTDCSFASPETAQDWGAIVHEGGPVRAFSRRMPMFGKALSEEQIAAVVAYVRSLCTDKRWAPGELNLPRSMATEKAFPENETVFTSDAITRRGERAIEFATHYERRMGARNQFEVTVPVMRAENAALGNWFAPGLGDIEVAHKRVLTYSAERGYIVSLNNEVIIPTGRESYGHGGGTFAYEPTLLAAKILPRNSYLHMQTGIELPFKKEKGEREGLFRAALGTSVGSAYGRSFSPMIEIAGARELEEGKPFEWDFVPQMQVTLSKRQHIAASIGLRLPLTEREARPRTLMMYLLWDWFDGGFFDGWR